MVSLNEEQELAHPNRQTVEEFFALNGESNAIFFDGLDEAIVGWAEQHPDVGPVVAYSVTKILKCLVSQGLTEDESEEWFSHNVHCLSVGSGTPVLVFDFGIVNWSSVLPDDNE